MTQLETRTEPMVVNLARTTLDARGAAARGDPGR